MHNPWSVSELSLGEGAGKNSLRKASCVDPAYWVSDYQWLVFFVDQPPSAINVRFVRIIIDALIAGKRFLIGYRVVSNITKRVVRIMRLIPDCSTLDTSRYCIVRPATPKIAQALDLHLEDLSHLLQEHAVTPHVDEEMSIFDIETNLFSWCIDRFEAVLRSCDDDRVDSLLKL